MTKTNLADNNYYLPNGSSLSSNLAKIYFSRRKYLKTLITTIHKIISLNSESYFLSLFLMDIIFLKENLVKQFYDHFPMKMTDPPKDDIQIKNYVLLSLVCLIISYKFTGKGSTIYQLNNIVNIIDHIAGEKLGFNARDLVVGEACVIKILKYKLNFCTPYHYLVFFYTYGIIFKKNMKQIGNNSEKNIFERIYVKARELMDYIVDNEKYFQLYNGKYNYILVCQILTWATETVLNIKIKNSDNIFKVIYNIKISEARQKKFLDILKSKNIIKKIIEIGDNNITSHTKFNKLNNKQFNDNHMIIEREKNNSIYPTKTSTEDDTKRLNTIYTNNQCSKTIRKNNSSLCGMDSFYPNYKNKSKNFNTISCNNKSLYNINTTINNCKDFKLSDIKLKTEESVVEKEKEKEPLDNEKNKKYTKKEIKNIILEKKNFQKEKIVVSFKKAYNNNQYRSSHGDEKEILNTTERDKLNSEINIKTPMNLPQKIKFNINNYKKMNSQNMKHENTNISNTALKNINNEKIRIGNKGAPNNMEPKDTIRKSVNKRLILPKKEDNQINNNINNNNKNSPKTIIINSNMNINIYINSDKNYNNNINKDIAELLNVENLKKVHMHTPNIILNEK